MMVFDTPVIRAEGVPPSAMLDALEEAGTRFVALLRSLAPADGSRPVPHMSWSVAETAAHMVTIIRRGLGDRRRADSIDGLAVLNQRSIDELEDRDPAVLADLLESDLTRYVERLRGTAAERLPLITVQLHAGIEADLVTGLSYQLCDLLAHGWDIAEATQRSWQIRPDHAILDLYTFLPALGPWIRESVLAGRSRRLTLTFPRSPLSLVAAVGDGDYAAATVERFDDDLEVDPIEAFLAVTGRVPTTNPLVTEIAGWFRPL